MGNAIAQHRASFSFTVSKIAIKMDLYGPALMILPRLIFICAVIPISICNQLQSAFLLVNHNIIAGRYVRIGRMSIHSSCCDIMYPILPFMTIYVRMATYTGNHCIGFVFREIIRYFRFKVRYDINSCSFLISSKCLDQLYQ